jgi:hypothetical protein
MEGGRCPQKSDATAVVPPEGGAPSPPWIPARSAARSSDEAYQKQLAFGLLYVARASRFPNHGILQAGGLRG